MIKCTHCGASQPDGTMFCGECGGSLMGKAARPREAMPFSRSSRPSSLLPMPDLTLSPTTEPRLITLVVPGNRQHLKIELADQIVIGRSDSSSDYVSDVDLTQYDGLELGVSRVHASLHLSDEGIGLCDLGSTNGTSINYNALPPQQAFLVRSGDEIQFGDLLVHIFFES